ncbi:MAG: hypothetical protein J6X60_13000 [Ruminiclostridium sp.]|nr:hypothetical protein [Ruminiclostridium sp.]
MAEFFDWLFNSGEADTIFGFVLLFGIGGLLYFVNWWLLLYNNIPKLNPKGRFVSMVPPLGGLLIAVGILLIGGGWWALIGLTDPSIWVFVYSLVSEFVSGGKKSAVIDAEPKENEKDEEENGD